MEQFYNLLTGGQPACWRTFADPEDMRKARDEGGKSLYCGHKYHGTLDQVMPQLQADNSALYGVYMVINQGGQSDGSIMMARACFIDIDEGGLPEQWHIPPSIIISRSDGQRHHAYWLLHAGAVDMGAWSTMQKRLIAQYKSDKTIHNPSRVMRVPQFLHWKDMGNPQSYSIVSSNGAIRYQLEDIATGLPELAPTSFTGPVTRGEVALEIDDAFSINTAVGYLVNAHPAVEGSSGDQTTFATAARVREYGLSEAKCVELMMEHWNPRCEPPWDISELTLKVANAYAYASKAQGSMHPAMLFPVPTPPDVPKPSARPHKPQIPGGNVMDIPGQIEYFRGVVYLEAQNRFLCPDGQIMKPEAFSARYSGYQFVLDLQFDKFTFKAHEAFTLSRGHEFPKAWGPCFRPEALPGAIVNDEGVDLVNIYTPAYIDRIKGDVTPFLTHLAKLLPNDRDRVILLSYMAACVQYPGMKAQWCPVVQGAEGNGKSFIGTALSHAVGRRYTHVPEASDLESQFNGWLQGNLLVIVEELKTDDKHTLLERMKPMITNKRIQIQQKGIDQTTGDNRANFICFSNHRDCVPIKRNGRRYAMLYTAQQSVEDLQRDDMPPDYFYRLYEWADNGGWAVIAHFLSEYEIPDEFNPKTFCQRAPETSSQREAEKVSLGRVEQEIMEAVDSEMPGFCDGWISSYHLTKLLESKGLERFLPPNKRKQTLEDIGYVQHPNLNNGRVNNAIAGEGKPRLYVDKIRKDLLNIKAPGEIADMYWKSQNPFAGGAV